VTTDEDAPATIDVLDNDTFQGEYGTDYAVTDVSDPANGTVTINDDGTVTYTPDPDFNGTDTFDYTVTVYNADGTTTTETATVTVNVTPEADIAADEVTTEEDTPATIDVLDNDTFQGDYGTDYEVTGVTDPANGSVVINADGTVTYTPDPDFNGTDTFDYTVTVYNADATTTTETATVTVTVTPVDDIADDTVTTDEDTPATIDVLDNDTFQGEYGTDYEVTGVTDPANGTVTINADGTVTYTPDPDFNGTDSFDYTVTVYNADGTTTTETATVTVNVTPEADIAADEVTTDEDTPATIDVLDNDTFQGDYGTDYEVTGVSDPANGTVEINDDGTVTYTPNPDFNGTDTFDYTVTVYNADGTTTTTETATVSVTVTPVDDIANDTVTTDEDTAITNNVLANDNFDGTPVITSVTQGANGTVEIVDANLGTVKYTPDPRFSGTDSYTYTVTSGGVPETATVNVIVNPAIFSSPSDPTPPATPPTEPPAADDATEPLPPVTFPDGDGSPGGVFTDGSSLSAIQPSVSLANTGFLESFVNQPIDPLRFSLTLQDQFITAEANQVFSLPANAIHHTDPSAEVFVEATLPDGSPLPSFVNFNAKNLEFRIDAAGLRESGLNVIDVKVKARDNYGNEASAIFRIMVVQVEAEEAEDSGEAAAGLSVVTDEDRISGDSSGDDLSEDEVVELDDDRLMLEGAPSLSEQVRLAGRLGFLEERDLLVEDAKSINLAA
ncbi:MAG: Ig-like domain-containing protein, partial [Desulfatiglandaceae bacterium]